MALRTLAFTFILPLAVHADMLFLIAGQSNAVGQGSAAQRVACLPNTAYEYDVLRDSVIPLADPAGQAWHLLEAARSEGGSVAPAFARALNRLSHERVFIVTAARGGSSCSVKGQLGGYGTWDSVSTASPANLVFPDAAEKTARAIAKAGLPLSGILWLQGERDANAIKAGGETAAEYRASLESVIGRFRGMFGAKVPFFIVKTGYQYLAAQPTVLDDTSGNAAVRKAQDAVASERDRIHIAYSGTHQFGMKQPSWMKDFVHYNQAGLNDIGDSAAAQVFAALARHSTGVRGGAMGESPERASVEAARGAAWPGRRGVFIYGASRRFGASGRRSVSGTAGGLP